MGADLVVRLVLQRFRGVHQPSVCLLDFSVGHMKTAEEAGHRQGVSRKMIVPSSALHCITLDVDEEVACFEFFLVHSLLPRAPIAR